MVPEKTVLIVETEVLIALDIQRILEDRNVRNTLFARAPQEIGPDAPVLDHVDLAIVEYARDNVEAHALVERLLRRGVPCILTSSDVRHRRGIDGLDGVVVLIKPFQETDLGEAARQALARLLG